MDMEHLPTTPPREEENRKSHSASCAAQDSADGRSEANNGHSAHTLDPGMTGVEPARQDPRAYT